MAEQSNEVSVPNAYNLLEEGWIPVVGKRSVSLLEVFENGDLKALSGSVLEKIALFKLLQAIAQAACTPMDDEEWKNLGEEEMGRRCVAYLKERRDVFWLYGEKPFLQYPEVCGTQCRSYGSLMAEIADGNTTLFFQSQALADVPHDLRARLLVTSMSCCFGGKRVDVFSLSPDAAKTKSAKPGPALCTYGLLHSFLLGRSLRQTVFFNLLTRRDIESFSSYSKGVGTAPWDAMPKGENDSIAQDLQASLMGRLVPMARFYLLDKDGVHCVEGIQHQSYLERMVDPSMTADFSKQKPSMLWANPNKHPWRSITALLSFLDEENNKHSRCLQLEWAITRLKKYYEGDFSIWAGGVRVSHQSGEQYLSGDDDSVESEVKLHTHFFGDNQWFINLSSILKKIDNISYTLKLSIQSYFKEFEAELKGVDIASHGERLFWQEVEKFYQKIMDVCAEEISDNRDDIIRKIINIVRDIYTNLCPQSSARQIQAFIRHTPHLSSGKQKEKE